MLEMDPTVERVLLGVAHALFMNRLHLLRLTEVVRLGVKPDDEGILDVPPKLDEELRKQAIDFVLMCFPQEFHVQIHEAKADWLRPM
ncbi:MAG: hypothetical protein D6689_08725 [Deltaproteobacteria bacterium]|nr:MAG: hypothetical protein D6689_08725 [Deltaproteobacteria bacterium]